MFKNAVHCDTVNVHDLLVLVEKSGHNIVVRSDCPHNIYHFTIVRRTIRIFAGVIQADPNDGIPVMTMGYEAVQVIAFVEERIDGRAVTYF
jgi:hypothetical protein